MTNSVFKKAKSCLLCLAYHGIYLLVCPALRLKFPRIGQDLCSWFLLVGRQSVFVQKADSIQFREGQFVVISYRVRCVLELRAVSRLDSIQCRSRTL